MPSGRRSLLAGRNNAALSTTEVRRALNIFLGLDGKVSVRHEPGEPTSFRTALDDDNEEYGEVVFGPDIYPGPSIIDPNSALSLEAAAAHELTHYHRWKDKIALGSETLTFIDEALTSLQAISRYGAHLNETDIRQLVGDAMQRLQLYIQELATPEAGGSNIE